MKDYYYVSEGIVNQFPEFEKSKAFAGPFGIKCYIAVVPNFDVVEKFYNAQKNPDRLFAFQCIDSNMTLTYETEDYDEDDNEFVVTAAFTIDTCKAWGMIEAMDQCLGISKERNVAYAIYKLAEKNKVTPIELIDLIYPFKPTTLEMAEMLKGKKLNVQEKFIIEHFGVDKEFYISLDHKGHICAHKLKR